MFPEKDYIVISKFYAKYFLAGNKSEKKSKFFLSAYKSTLKKVIFNQNSYITLPWAAFSDSLYR